MDIITGDSFAPIGDFYETTVDTYYPGTPLNIEFQPTKKYTKLIKFLSDIKLQMDMCITEALQTTTPTARVLISLNVENDWATHSDEATIKTAGMLFSDVNEIDILMEQMFIGLIYDYSTWSWENRCLGIESILGANLRIATAEDNYIDYPDLGLVTHHLRTGSKHKYRRIR